MSDKVTSFCQNPSLELWNKLPEDAKSFFLNIFMHVPDDGYKGLATVIKNIKNYQINISSITRPTSIYGVRQITFMESETLSMKICLMDDSHSLQYKCTPNSNAVSGSYFIKEQTKFATCFVDVYLEIPYIHKSNQKILYAKNSYMKDLQSGNMGECFKWSKDKCRYHNLRAHNINLRNNDYIFDVISKFFSNVFHKVKVEPPDKEFRDKVSKIFKDKNTLIKYMENILERNKIFKQINNINNQGIKDKINFFLDKWLYDPDINFKYLDSKYLLSTIDNLSDNLEENKVLVTNIFYSITGYTGVIMDIYTLARIFRDYTVISYRNSSSAKNIFVYAGGFHITRYITFLKDLGMFRETFATEKSDNNCVQNPFTQKLIF